jgi:structural maintenance of chromosome 4
MESPPPTTKATKPASKGKARATPVVEEPRRRSGRLSSRASSASVSQETPVVKGKEMQKEPAISRKPLKVVEQEDEEEKQDATSEDEAESLLDGDEEEDDDPIASPQHPKPKPEPSPTPVDRDATPVPSTPSHRQQGSPTPQPPSPQPSLHAAPPPPSPTPKPKPEGPQKRLIIHKMVLENFKSYAGRQEIGPFHKVRPSLLSFIDTSSLFFHLKHHLQSYILVLTILYRNCGCVGTVLLCNRRSERFGQVQHHRRPPLRLRLPGVQDASGEAWRVDP